MTEFVDKNGIICYRLARHKTISKHRFLYQTYNNCILLTNEVVIFLDGNNRNFNPENLYKITRAELVLLNRWYKISSDPYKTLDYIALVKLKQRRVEIAKENNLTNKYGAIVEDKKESQKRYYSLHPEVKGYAREYQRKKRQDPVWREEFNRKRRERRKNDRLR